MRDTLHLAILLSLLVRSASVAASAPLNDDVLGLIVFKADLLDPASELASWDDEDADSPCGWAGVTCDPRSGRVTDLALDSRSLSGRVGPRGLLQLRYLRLLSLANNNFTGTLSADLAGLDGLRVVDLSSNALSGPIPDELFHKCGSLRSVSLANNAFEGELPPSLGSCAGLSYLNLSSNRISGPLPAGVWSLNGLRSLDLSENSFVGEIPSGIESLYNLRTISLRRNSLSGKVPEGIGGCLLLKSIDLSENSLSGGLPDSMRNLTMCGSLSLSSNSFVGELPDWIGEMSSLETLDLSRNRFIGHIPGSIGNLRMLKELNLSRNGFTGALPESMEGCKGLTNVDLSRNSLTGDVPSWVFELGVQRISISENGLSGEMRIPSAVNRNLQVLDLSENSVSGPVPSNLGSLQGLQLLNLSRNSLSGPIPSSIGGLKDLGVLDLSMNRINGSIPSEIGGAAALKELRLAKNFIAGKIPTQIGECASLTSLILRENNLTGPIPTTLSNLTNLQTVDLSSNHLSGPLPKQLSDLPHLHLFNISHNFLQGDLPPGTFFNTIPPSSLSDNPNLCGSALNRSCPAVLPKPIVLNPNSSSSSSSTPSSLSNSTLHHKTLLLSISALIAIAALALIAFGVAAVIVLNLRVRTSSSAAPPADDDFSSDANSGRLVMFSGDDPDFSAGAHALLNKDCELGRGGFGSVYRTVLGDGRPVAVKKLTVSSLVKSREEFESEARRLGRIRHPNVVALEGYYWTPSLQLLVYEFVFSGSLYKHLHENSSARALSWRERFDVILGIARGLAHLHRMNVVHYNLKSSNILIDGAGEPKIGDYGLAKLLPMLDRYVLSAKIQSALGYMAPEFACRTVKITEKCDVYGFGVLVLEVVTGRRPVEYMEDDVVVLCDAVRADMEEGRAEECVDGRLRGEFPVGEAVPVVKLGLICTSQVPSNRPEMAEVVNILELIRCPG
ncbi:inactive leucine-rich repeat receptor-like protein kinase [Acorus gramineus]|uniref:Inactive leucine-rich repeat receptor-like protein kinase n=1 Tax=Acorus gramineus TaxID=55184 RepID=A0AAV9AM35_ACOGR|nr:inactive leucine-rich repeat receptor-like protein kinase [Acorus gramineus]